MKPTDPLTLDEIRERIAIILGWKKTSAGHGGEGWINPANGHKYDIKGVPDFPRSLDAVHIAWKTLTPAQHETFRYALQRIVWIEGHVEGPCRSCCNAVADQRARAFISIFDPVLFEEIQEGVLVKLSMGRGTNETPHLHGRLLHKAHPAKVPVQVEVNNVVQVEGGRKYVAGQPHDLPEGAKIVAEHPHDDEDYSYCCGRDHCRCMQ